MNQTIYDAYKPVVEDGPIFTAIDQESHEASRKISNAFSLIDAMVEIEFEEMRDRIDGIQLPVVDNQEEASTTINRPYDWAIDDVDTDQASEVVYKPSLFPKIYDWALDGEIDNLINDDTELFNYHISEHEIGSLILPADEKGLFADYTATGLTGKFLDNKKDISDKDQDAFFKFAYDNDFRKADIDALTGTEISPMRTRIRQVLGKAALVTALVVGSIFVPSNKSGSEDIKNNTTAAHTLKVVPGSRVAPKTSTAPVIEQAAPVTVSPETVLASEVMEIAPVTVSRTDCEDPAGVTQGFGATPETIKNTMEYLINKHGATPKGAAYLTGNFLFESRLNPQAIGDGGLAKGLAQWHPNRRPHGLPGDLYGQIDYAINEMKTSRGGGLLTALRNPDASDQQFRREIFNYEGYGVQGARYEYGRRLGRVACEVTTFKFAS